MRGTLKRLENRPYEPYADNASDYEQLERLAPAGDYMRPRTKASAQRETTKKDTQSLVRILTVEDDLFCRRMLRVVLAHSRIQVTEVETGEAAIDMLAMRPFELVMMDASLTDMSGLEALQWIRRSNTPWADIPVIGMIEQSQSGRLGAMRSAGLTDATPKPLDREDIIAKLVGLMPGLYDAGV